jgi:hypothetical protein
MKHVLIPHITDEYFTVGKKYKIIAINYNIGVVNVESEMGACNVDLFDDDFTVIINDNDNITYRTVETNHD